MFDSVFNSNIRTEKNLEKWQEKGKKLNKFACVLSFV